MIKRLLFGVIICAGLCAVAAPHAWTLRFDGIGPVKIGMTTAQLNTALHETFVVPKDEDSQACFYVYPARHTDVALMLEKGYVTRVDLTQPQLSTADGIHMGDAESLITQKYGPKLKIEPHHYDDNGHYLTLLSPDGKNGIRFETISGTITSIYAGQLHAIAYVEGCS
jgi:hypothetical protein